MTSVAGLPELDKPEKTEKEDDKLRKKAGQVLERRIRAFTNDRELERRTRRYLWILGQHFDEIVFRTPQQREIGQAASTDGASPATAPAELHARVEELAARLADRNEDLEEAKKELARARDKINLLKQRDWRCRIIQHMRC